MQTNNRRNSWCAVPGRRRLAGNGFTLIELLVVIAILATLALAFIGYLHWLGDKKWEDEKRTHQNRRFLRLVRTLWGTVMVGLCIALGVNFAQKEKASEFTLYLNGVRVGTNTLVTLPLTNGTAKIRIALRNDGNAPANGFFLSVRIPSQIRVTPSN